MQSVFDGRVYGITFGADRQRAVGADRTHARRQGAAVSARLAEERGGGRWELDGTPALQGLAFDPARKSPLVGLIGAAAGGGQSAGRRGAPPRARPRPRVGRRGAARLHLAVASDLGRHLAGGPALASDPAGASRRAAARARERAGDRGCRQRGSAGPRQDRRRGAVRRGDQPRRRARRGSATGAGAGPRTATRRCRPAPTPNADRVVVDARGIAVDRHGRARRSRDAHGHGDGRRRPASRRRSPGTRRVSVSTSPTPTATRSRWSTPPRRASARTIAIKPFGLDARRRAPTALARRARRRDALRRARRIQRRRGASRTADGAMRGLIPTAWYPNQLALTPDGRKLADRDAARRRLGRRAEGSGAPLRPRVPRHGPRRCRCRTRRSSPATRRRSRRTITSPRRARSSPPKPPARTAAPAAVPRRAGDPSLIEHVVYIIKENRTYDQLFGDLPRGNGEPSFVMFGEDVTPNHRKLATEFVLLDNFYATGGNSGDGHQWVTQASETSYALWPGYVGRSYPFDGTDPIAYANTGFLWDLALARERTVRVFGEYAGRLPETDRGQRERLLERWRAGDDFTQRVVDHGAARAAQQGAGAQLSVLLADHPGRGARADLPEGAGAVEGRPARCRTWSSCSCRAITRAAPRRSSQHRQGDGRRQRPRARPDRRGAVALAVLEEDGDPRRRGRRAERRRSRRRPSDHRAGDLALRPARSTSTRRSTRTRAWSRRSS